MVNSRYKFRAWDSENKHMFQIARFDLADYTVYSHLFACGGYLGESLKIMQYTGLQDKNGKDIYERHIIETEKTVYNVHGSYCGVEKVRGVVGFGNGRYSLHCENSNQDLIFGLHYHEIIGNAYENPELLEEL